MTTVVADCKIPFLRGVLEPWFNVHYLPPAEITSDTLRNAEILITRTRTKCAAALLDGTAVRTICSATIGFDHIDAAYCESKQIRWFNAPGCNADSVAQYIAAALLFASARFGEPLRGKTLGVVGAGHVGTKVIRIGEALGMRVLVCDPPRARNEGQTGFVSLERIAADSDYITCHTPLIRTGCDRTWHLADESFFSSLKRCPVFLNTSRGEVAGTGALKSAIITKRVRAAILDVWENEPDPDDELLALTMLGTPHIAGYSADGKANGTSMAVRKIAELYGIQELASFYPDAVPEPEGGLTIRLKGKPDIASVVRAAYDIGADSNLLRADASEFEALRGAYRIRREFSSWTLQTEQVLASEVKFTLGRLGFKGI